MKRLSATLLAFVSSAAPLLAEESVAVDKGWLTVNNPNLEIVAGSPLDFSPLFPEQKIDGRVDISPQGQLTVSGKPRRFLCSTVSLTPPYGGFPDHATADRLARQMRRAGYNLARFHYVDATLMSGRKGDFDYHPEQLDRFYYLLAALRQQGIYWMIDGLSSVNGAYGNVEPHRWVNRHSLMAKVQVDDAARRHWRKLQETLYARVNPYTGRSTLADDALMGIILVNEGGFQFQMAVDRKIPDAARPALVAWLKQRYPQAAAFEKIWRQPAAQLDASRLQLPDHEEQSPRMEDVLAFFDERQADTGRWMEAALRELGYRGPVTAYNNMPTTHMARSRARFPWVDMHAYHDEASGREPGSRIANTSSFDNSLGWLADLASHRIAGKAFTVSEWGQPFWNSWRYESSLTVPTWAALQGWDAICQHASSTVDLDYRQKNSWKEAMMPYTVGLDPITRAGETLGALLFRRGDVRTDTQFTRLAIEQPADEASAKYWGLPREISRHALRGRVALDFTQGAVNSPTVRENVPITAQSRLEKWLQALDRGEDFSTFTGEISASIRRRQLQLRTENTVAVAFDRLSAPLDLGYLRINQASRGGLVALSSLDALPLGKSRKMLLIVATDALNTGMRFKAADRKELAALGLSPPRLAPIRLQLDLRDARELKAISLGLDGSTGKPLKLLPARTFTSLDLDTGREQLATTYFLIQH